MKQTKLQVLSELMDICKQRLAEGKMVPEFVKPLDVAGMIKGRIKVLSFQWKVEGLEKQLLTDFNNITTCQQTAA